MQHAIKSNWQNLLRQLGLSQHDATHAKLVAAYAERYRPAIYLTPRFAALFEKPARANLARTIRTL